MEQNRIYEGIGAEKRKIEWHIGGYTHNGAIASILWITEDFFLKYQVFAHEDHSSGEVTILFYDTEHKKFAISPILRFSSLEEATVRIEGNLNTNSIKVI